ncbi:hypothetical protein L1281_001557 [Neisseria sp. HSC-16F19]|nr:hypothetical protein [Neisseria sp. HSC-16F19]MCP2040967.1 hypothetical protein [Neisseria sp. HSC-16F19]
MGKIRLAFVSAQDLQCRHICRNTRSGCLKNVSRQQHGGADNGIVLLQRPAVNKSAGVAASVFLQGAGLKAAADLSNLITSAKT